MPRRPARFTQADIARALRAVAQAGVNAAVEIAPGGTIRVVLVDPAPNNPPASGKLAIKREITL